MDGIERKFANEQPICHNKLLVSFGISPKSSPKSKNLVFCPGVQQSCCDNDDQSTIFKAWILG